MLWLGRKRPLNFHCIWNNFQTASIYFYQVLTPGLKRRGENTDTISSDSREIPCGRLQARLSEAAELTRAPNHNDTRRHSYQLKRPDLAAASNVRSVTQL